MSSSAAGALSEATDVPLPKLVLRCLLGGVFMGLANLVPGISGGTMLLAAGVYPNFIGAISDLSRLRFRIPSLVSLGAIVAAAALAILLLAGPVKDLVVHYRWVMYSLFIGLTLGGVPVVWKLAKPVDGRVWAGAVAGFSVMAGIALFQAGGASGEAEASGFAMMFVAGVAGASAMILPGISGGYLLLVLGVYVPLLGAISDLKDAAKAMDVAAMMGPAMSVAVPVGLGVLVGVFAVSNALRIALSRFEKPTLGALLGFLVGAVVGLWPFQQGVAPKMGDTFKGRTVTPELLETIEPSKYPTELFTPNPGQVLGALALIALGVGITALVARIGRTED